MTVREYYRASIGLPFVAMVPGLALGLVSTKGIHNPLLRFVAGLPITFVFAGLFAAVPYGAFLLVVWRFFRPESEHDHRRVAFIAPIALAIALAIIAVLLESIGHGPLSGADLLGTIGLWGGLALGFGYFYVALLELGLVISKRFGWVERAPAA